MKSRPSVTLQVAFATFLAVPFALTDDGNGYRSGTAFHLGGKTHVRMDRGTILIRVEKESADVYCRFAFVNEGPAEDVLIGFPDAGGGADAGYPALSHFVSRVDGRRAEMALLDGALKPAAMHADQSGDFLFYHVKKVHFRAHQTRIVEDWYRSKLGGSVPDYSHFEYVMRTGRSWNGPIRSATVRIVMANHGSRRTVLRPSSRLSGRGGIPRIHVYFHGFAEPSVHGNVVIFHRRNFKPDEDSDIRLTFRESRR